MRLAIVHVLRVVGGLVSYAVRTRRPGLVVLVVVGGMVVIGAFLVQVLGPVAIYPFV